MKSHLFTLTVWTLLVVGSGAQFVNWVENQVNTSICTWEQPRAALIRDTIYIDGGTIWWSPGLSTGDVLPKVTDGNLQGVILSYNLSTSFDADTNVTGILLENKLYKGRGGSDASGSIPNFYDGAMLTNNASFFLYAGVTSLENELYETPDDNYALAYERYSYGLDKPLFQPGFKDTETSRGVSNYLSYGGAVSAPSENKAWYFSGLQSPSGGPIYLYPTNASTNSTSVTRSIVTLDFGIQYQQNWTNQTLPSQVNGRANPEIVWVPVGTQGILVVLGGVVDPEWVDTSGAHKSANPTESKRQSPQFMQAIDIYDVANNEWYHQPTSNAPGMRARGCAVVATAPDKSSFNIYYYGGTEGLNLTSPFYDEVWVLSLPSFSWTLLSEGESSHSRAGHKCFSPYPDQMMVVGGYTSSPEGEEMPSCLSGGVVINFNMSSGEWLTGYDPTVSGDYTVPTKVLAAIGGHATGSATATAPPSGWATQGLGDVFKTAYNDDKLEKWWPYPPAPAITPTNGAGKGSEDKNHNGSSLPKWVAPVLGTVLSLMILALVAVLVFLCRSGRLSPSLFGMHSREGRSKETGLHILSWIKGQPVTKILLSTSSEGTGPSAEMEDAGSLPTIYSLYPPQAQEMASDHIVELGECQSPSELPDWPLSPEEVINKHTKFGRNPFRTPSVSDPSYSSSLTGGGDLSSLSQYSHPHHTLSLAGSARIDSPTISSPLPFSKSISSQFSSHIGESDTSGTGGRNAQPRSVEAVRGLERISEDKQAMLTDTRSSLDGHDMLISPVSPPIVVERSSSFGMGADDVSPIRRSLFKIRIGKEA